MKKIQDTENDYSDDQSLDEDFDDDERVIEEEEEELEGGEGDSFDLNRHRNQQALIMLSSDKPAKGLIPSDHISEHVTSPMHQSYLLEYENQEENKQIKNIFGADDNHQSYLLELPSNSNLLSDINNQSFVIPNTIKENDDENLETKL